MFHFESILADTNVLLFLFAQSAQSSRTTAGPRKERGRRFGAWPVHTIQQVRILSIVGKQLMIASLTISL